MSVQYGAQNTAAGSGQWGTNVTSTTPGANGTITNSYSFAPSQYAQSQTALGNAQATAVHDPLQAAQLTEANKMTRFNDLMPLLSGQFSRLNNGFATAGGSNGTPPPITTGPVLNDAQIQQQVNTARASNDAQTQGQIQNSANSVAGRGFGGNSPLAMQLSQGFQNSNQATNTANETATRLGAAQQNASHLLNTQQALSNQWATGNQLDIQRRAPIFAQQNALIAALGGLMN